MNLSIVKVFTVKIIYFGIVFCIVQACNGQNKMEGKLIGEWLSFRTEKFVSDKFDFLGKGDSLETFYSVKERYEFSRNGKGKELTLAPHDVFSFDYELKGDTLFFYDRKFKMEMITSDTLILSEFDEQNASYDFDPTTPFQNRVHFKRIR